MYMNDANLRGSDDEFEYDEDMIEELYKCSQDPIYFIENYITITDAQVAKKFELRDYQKDYIRLLNDNTRVIIKWGRQSGKSVTTAAYITWRVMFHENVKVLLLADQLSKAVEQLKRVKEMVESMPLWMQAGVKKWAEQRISFLNKSEIKAAATSKKAASGFTVNFLYLDEFALVDSNIAKDFMTSVFPTVSSDPNAKIAISSTPRGMNAFYEIWAKAEKKKESGTLERNDFRTYQIPWNAVPGRDDAWRATEIENMGEVAFNQEYACTFEGSVATLVDSKCLLELRRLYERQPVSMLDNNKLRIFSWPISQKELKDNNYEYLITVDPAMGTKQDYTVSQVWLIRSNTDIEQVAVYQSNDIPPFEYVAKILALCKMYYNPNVMIETMEPAGGIIIGSLMKENDYYNIINMQKEGIGFRMSHDVKIKSCTLLQVYCEKLLLKIRDASTLSELSMFGKRGNTYKALGDGHDDLVMTILSMLFYVNSRYFYGNVDDVSIYRKKTHLVSSNVDANSDPLIKEALERMMADDEAEHRGFQRIPFAITNSSRKFDDAVNWREPPMANQRNNPMFNPHSNGNGFMHFSNGY